MLFFLFIPSFILLFYFTPRNFQRLRQEFPLPPNHSRDGCIQGIIVSFHSVFLWSEVTNILLRNPARILEDSEFPIGAALLKSSFRYSSGVRKNVGCQSTSHMHVNSNTYIIFLIYIYYISNIPMDSYIYIPKVFRSSLSVSHVLDCDKTIIYICTGILAFIK